MNPASNSPPPTPIVPSGGVDDGVRLAGEYPLTWMSAAEDLQWSADQMYEAQTVLRGLLVLDEAAHRAADQGSRGASPEIECRLDLLLLMLGSAIRQWAPLPAARPCTFTASGVEWLHVEALDVGAHGWLSVYLQPRLPAPLRLPSRIVSAQTTPTGGWQLGAQFAPLPEALAPLLTQYVFRHHRRAVARRRASSLAD